MRFYNHPLMALEVYHNNRNNEWQITVPVRDTAKPFVSGEPVAYDVNNVVRHMSDHYTYIDHQYIYITATPGSDDNNYGSTILPPRIAELITEAIDEAHK